MVVTVERFRASAQSLRLNILGQRPSFRVRDVLAELRDGESEVENRIKISVVGIGCLCQYSASYSFVTDSLKVSHISISRIGESLNRPSCRPRSKQKTLNSLHYLKVWVGDGKRRGKLGGGG